MLRLVKKQYKELPKKVLDLIEEECIDSSFCHNRDFYLLMEGEVIKSFIVLGGWYLEEVHEDEEILLNYIRFVYSFEKGYGELIIDELQNELKENFSLIPANGKLASWYLSIGFIGSTEENELYIRTYKSYIEKQNFKFFNQ